MKKPTPPLTLEQLESRHVPALFGNPWFDGAHLTLSFAPDGTDVYGSPSALFAKLGPQTNVWQTEILRAFQTWAEQTNVNIGLVADGGQGFDVSGAVQGDPRFGDIRIGSRTLGPDALAATSPFTLFGATAGNVTVNQNAPFSIGGVGGTYDLYSALLQEAGHAQGVGNSLDPTSPMFEQYSGVRTGLTDGDIQAIQGLYGARTPDAYEGARGNDTLATASAFANGLEADVTTRQDVDVYRFTAIGLPTTVRLQAAGLSLLVGKVSVLDSSGRVIASGTASGPLKNDVTLQLNGLVLGRSYFVKVESGSPDAFGVGAYRLRVDTLVSSLVTTLGTTTTNLVGGVVAQGNDLGTNDSMLTATLLIQKQATADKRYDYNVRAVLSNSSDVDYFRLTAPDLSLADRSAGQGLYLVATVWGLDGTAPDARVDVYDAYGRAIAGKVLTNDDGSFTVQLANVSPKADYFVRVQSDTGRTGGYEVAVDFRTDSVMPATTTTGTLTSDAPVSVPVYLTTQSQMLHFALTAAPASTAAVVLSIYDQAGNLVFSLAAGPGDTQSGDVFLNQGTYKIAYTAVPPAGTKTFQVGYTLDLWRLTDPIGPQASDPATQPSSGSPPPSSDGGSGATYWYSSAPPPGSGSWF